MSETELYFIDIPEHEPFLENFYSVLSAEEQARTKRSTGRKRNQTIVSRGALRYLLADRFNVRPSDLTFGYSEHGKPYIKNPKRLVDEIGEEISFSVSHSGNTIAYALGAGAPLGVDLEDQTNSPGRKAALQNCVYPECLYEITQEVQKHLAPETTLLALWTLYEATIKYNGWKANFSYHNHCFQMKIPQKREFTGQYDFFQFTGRKVCTLLHHGNRVQKQRVTISKNSIEYRPLAVELEWSNRVRPNP